MDMCDQVWQSSIISCNRLATEINRVFTLNENVTKTHRNAQKYYDVNLQAVLQYAQKGSVILKSGWKLLSRSAPDQYGESISSTEASTVTENRVMSASGIEHFIRQQVVEIDRDGEVLVPKALKVVRLRDVADHMQVAIITKQLIAEQKNGAMIRLVSPLSTPISTSLALFTGEIRLYASATTDPPADWLRCNGSRVSRVTYSRLFTVIGTTYDVGTETQPPFNCQTYKDVL